MNTNEKNSFTLIDENGNETKYDVLFTFQSDETNILICFNPSIFFSPFNNNLYLVGVVWIILILWVLTNCQKKSLFTLSFSFTRMTSNPFNKGNNDSAIKKSNIIWF